MRAKRTGATTLLLRTALLASALIVGCIPFASQADAANQSGKPQTATAHPVSAKPAAAKATNGKARTAAAPRSYSISCVPYARMVSGIAVAGNAWQWWDNASGTYARGHAPETGSVLAFRSNYAMRMGHVAVVSRVINAREILIDHANWPRGGVWRDVAVVDVSESNDWSAVRVERGNGGDFGSVYPVNGFIYNRGDSGILESSNRSPAPQVALNPAPRDLRPASARGFDEVAEAPVRRAVRKPVALHPQQQVRR